MVWCGIYGCLPLTLSKYDWSVVNDGRKNNYSHSIKEKNVILAPYKEEVVSAPEVEKENMSGRVRLQLLQE